MITIFTVPEPFTEKIRKSRINAINSWRRLQPNCEIILFGGDKDLAKYALETGVRHVPEVARSDLGTPLLSDIFDLAQKLAQGDVLMFSNCDIIFYDDLHAAIAAVRFEKYMLCGRRWDIDVSEEIAINDEPAWLSLRSQYGRKGRMHAHSGLDYFIFPKTMRIEMPPFVIGRPGWDSWFVWHLRASGIPVIDGTGAIKAFHQNHDYTHLKLGSTQYTGPEKEINYKLAGGYMKMLSLREANWIISDGEFKRQPWPKRIWSIIGPFRIYCFLLAVKRYIQHLFR